MIQKLFQGLSAHDRRLTSAFFLAALAAGPLAFLVGHGTLELFTAPSYRQTLPRANEVDAATVQARLRAAAFPVRTTVETSEYGNWIRVPALSLNFPLVAATTMTDTDVLRALQVGVVRYPNGVPPGGAGVVVVAGHSTGEPWKGRYRFAFLNARKLRPGDIIDIDHDGVRYSYRVTGQRLINQRKTKQLSSVAASPRLAVISCWPLWTTQKRLVVDAELQGTAKLARREALTAQ